MAGDRTVTEFRRSAWGRLIGLHIAVESDASCTGHAETLPRGRCAPTYPFLMRERVLGGSC